MAITQFIMIPGLQKRPGGETSYPPIHTLNIKNSERNSAGTQAIVKFFYVFDCPEHNFESRATKRLGSQISAIASHL